MAGKHPGSQFIVHLQGIELPPEIENQIAKEVRAVVMRELARIDLKGDIGFRIPQKEWLGIWIDRLNPIDLPFPSILSR